MSKLHSHPLRFGGMTLCNIFEEEKKKTSLSSINISNRIF